jgi:RNA polymerase sigma factor (sigma-70 family)
LDENNAKLSKRKSSGKESQFWQEWESCHKDIYRRCLWWMNANHADAEDALTKAAIKAHRNYSNEKKVIRDPLSWFSKIAKNICIDMLREKTRHRDFIEKAYGESDIVSQGMQHSMSLEEAAVRSETHKTLLDMINSLPPALKQAFQFRVIHGLGYDDIAGQLHITPANVRKRVQLAKANLRKSFAW